MLKTKHKKIFPYLITFISGNAAEMDQRPKLKVNLM